MKSLLSLGLGASRNGEGRVSPRQVSGQGKVAIGASKHRLGLAAHPEASPVGQGALAPQRRPLLPLVPTSFGVLRLPLRTGWSKVW